MLLGVLGSIELTMKDLGVHLSQAVRGYAVKSYTSNNNDNVVNIMLENPRAFLRKKIWHDEAINQSKQVNRRLPFTEFLVGLITDYPYQEYYQRIYCISSTTT